MVKKDKKKIFKESKIFYKILDVDWQKNNFVEKKKQQRIKDT